MPEKCTRCGQDFEIETGFYLGAMYVSYGITVAINVAIFTLLVVLDAYSIAAFFVSIFIVLLFTLPYVIKVSRSAWIALTVKYDSQAIKNYETQHSSY